MEKTLCIAMAYDGEPLVRYAVGRHRKLIYVIEPSLYVSAGNSAKRAVGFPQECVFEYEISLYNKMLDAYQKDDRFALGELWGQIKPLQLLDVPREAV